MRSRKLEAMILLGAAAVAGCSSAPYTQIQAAYGKGEYFPETGNISLICGRARVGGKAADYAEFRLGADVCFAKLPDKVTQDTFSIDLGPIFGKKEAVIDGITTERRVSISVPVEYDVKIFEANIPSDAPEELGLRVPGYHDVELHLITGVGYTIDVTTKKMDYTSGDNAISSLPGVDIDGNFYLEPGLELLLFGRIPVGTSIRLNQGKDGDANNNYFFSGGGRIQW
ncbi:MAG: hypothetical protein AABX05_00170 [Nanoarchaeota archaeon]